MLMVRYHRARLSRLWGRLSFQPPHDWTDGSDWTFRPVNFGFCRSISDFSCMEHELAWSSLISSRAISRHNLVGVHDETPAVHAVHAPSIDLREVKAGPPRTMLRPDQPILTHRAVVSGHAHDTPADSAEPLPKLLGRDVPIL